jgi:hypothetical protein
MTRFQSSTTSGTSRAFFWVTPAPAPTNVTPQVQAAAQIITTSSYTTAGSSPQGTTRTTRLNASIDQTAMSAISSDKSSTPSSPKPTRPNTTFMISVIGVRMIR